MLQVSFKDKKGCKLSVLAKAYLSLHSSTEEAKVVIHRHCEALKFSHSACICELIYFVVFLRQNGSSIFFNAFQVMKQEKFLGN